MVETYEVVMREGEVVANSGLVLFVATTIVWRMAKLARLARIAPLVLGLGACTTSVTHFGDAPPNLSVAANMRFAIAPTSNMAPARAVRDALVAAGFQEAADAPEVIEVGFAVRPSKLQVTAPDGRVLSPSTKALPSLCHRQAYVLSVAIIERASGRIAKRMGAATSRCHATPAEILPTLAQAAVNPMR